LARKLAAIHCLEVPIQRDPSVVFDQYYEVIEKAAESPPSLEKMGHNERVIAEAILSVDLKAELIWIREQATKMKSRIVFGHNDYHMNNVLLRTDTSLDFEDRLVVIDVEMCGYFYRGLDFGTLFNAMRVDFGDILNPHWVGTVSEDRKRFFIREYLKEWQKLNPKTFDPMLDTEDNILLEANLLGLFREIILLLFARKMMDVENPGFAREKALVS
jgi:hypothetical protein